MVIESDRVATVPQHFFSRRDHYPLNQRSRHHRHYNHHPARHKVLPTSSSSPGNHVHHQPSPQTAPPPPPLANGGSPANHGDHNGETVRPTNGHHNHVQQPHQSSSSSGNHQKVPNGHYLTPRNGNANGHSPASGGSNNSDSRNRVNYLYIKRLCRERGVLFEDNNFVASNRSLFGKKEVPSNSCNFLSKILSSIVWMRPHEICSRPKFINDGPSRFDVEQGEAIIALTASNKPTGSSSFPNISSSPSSSHYHQSLDQSFSKTMCSSLLSAISCLTLTPKLMDRVVPSDQSFAAGHYCGIFKFNFWHFGEWTEVIVDDRLPTFKGRLLFLRSVDPTEFWAALLEKAYAKLHGNYEYYLKHCFTAQTLQDLTGGIAQSFTIPHHDGHIIYQMIASAVPRSTLLSACISTTSTEGLSPTGLMSHPTYAFTGSPSSSALSAAMMKLQPCRLRSGLITRQSYSITGLARVRTSSRTLGHNQSNMFTGFQFINSHNLSTSVAVAAAAAAVNGGPGAAAAVAGTSGSIEVVLIRLRNAWGKGEWNGPWSERSWEWDTLSDHDKQELSARCRDDGEFWMSFDDFLRYFTHLDLVHIGPDDWMNETSLHHKRPWRAVLARRRWRHGFNAGGSPDHKETFATNPQFHIHISKNGLNKCHVVVSVTQYYVTNPYASSELTRISSSPNHVFSGDDNTASGGSSGGGCVGSGSSSSRDERSSPNNLHHIGFCVYEVPPGMKRLSQHFVTAHRPLDVTAFSATRETVTFFTLPPGDFIIVPSTDKPHCETKFLLRILTDEPSAIWEVNDDNVLCSDLVIPRVVENACQVCRVPKKEAHLCVFRMLINRLRSICHVTLVVIVKRAN